VITFRRFLLPKGVHAIAPGLHPNKAIVGVRWDAPVICDCGKCDPKFRIVAIYTPWDGGFVGHDALTEHQIAQLSCPIDPSAIGPTIINTIALHLRDDRPLRCHPRRQPD
jgi:hypothetical protein